MSSQLFAGSEGGREMFRWRQRAFARRTEGTLPKFRLEPLVNVALAREDEKRNCECMEAEPKTQADAMDGGMESVGRNGR
ncbi:MAG: hypothetical protein ACKOAU_03000 [Pirellula sp.]